MGTVAGALAPAILTPQPVHASTELTYGGPDLAGWTTVLGDGLYTAAGQDPVHIGDISTEHHGSHTTLHANSAQRGVMAHNLTYQSIQDAAAFDYVHICGYKFRLPYLPTPGAWPHNAQTIEGALMLWDGANTRMDHGMAFQWVLNPWMGSFGEIWAWSGEQGGQWVPSGFLAVDTEWHEVQMVYDHRNQATALRIDGVSFPSVVSQTPKPAWWGNEVAGRFNAEIISLWPGTTATAAPSHLAEVKEWYWNWVSYE
jgi:hypothetical protein